MNKMMIMLMVMLVMSGGLWFVNTNEVVNAEIKRQAVVETSTRSGVESATAVAVVAAKPSEELLWVGAPPFANGTERKDLPRYQAYLPAKGKGTGAAVVVLPGGGYGHLAMGHDGHEIGMFFIKHGIAAIVVQYRLGPKYRHPTMITDAQRAIRTTRFNAKKWGIDPDKIGVMGFSAGGHLASTALTRFDGGMKDGKDGIDKVSCRPDFGILCYPVIATDTNYTHVGSRRNLLGKNPDPKLVASLSNHKQVKKDTPPTFLFHTNADTAVPAENSVYFYLALRKHKIPAELHIYEKGRHGVGLASKDAILSTWSGRLIDWLRTRKVIQ